LSPHTVGGKFAKCASISENSSLIKSTLPSAQKIVENIFKNDYALLQIPRICLIRMLSDIPLSAVKNVPIPMKHGSFSVVHFQYRDIPY
jgi:hypothetical protein